MSKSDTERTKIGTWLSIGSTTIAELCAECKLSWILIDREHGCGDEASVLEQLRATRGSSTKAIVRIPRSDKSSMIRALDAGASGIMVPHIDSPDQAEECLELMRYYPAGNRGVSRTVRAYRYGLDMFDKNNKPILMVQIETLRSVNCVDEIAAVDGVDVLFIGPSDLKHCLGQTVGENVPTLQECLERVSLSARSYGKESGILLRDISEIPKFIEMEFRWLAIDSDLGILKREYLRLAQTKI